MIRCGWSACPRVWLAWLAVKQKIAPPQAEIYVGSPVYVFQRVLDELYWQIRRCYLPPPERSFQLEFSRKVASVIPAERRDQYLRAGKRLPSVLSEHAIAGEVER